MMPFGVLRIWGSGLWSWVLVGLAVWCFYEWHRRSTEDRPRVDAQAEASKSDEPQPMVRGTMDRSRRAWPFLAAGIALTGICLGGFIPVTVLASQPGFSRPVRIGGAEVKTIARPDGSRLHVESIGEASGTALVFTHGWSLDSSAWAYLQRELQDGFRVVTWDLPGLGESKGPRNGDYSLEKMATDLNAVVQECGAGSVILIGHSIGGMITQTYCRLFPEQLGPRVGGIVLLQTTYTNPLNTAFGAALWKAIEKPVLVPLNHLTVWLAPLAWISNWQSYLNGSLHWMTRMASFSGRQTWGELNYGAWLAAKAWPGVVARGNLAMLRFDEQPTLAKLNVPCLIVRGDHDRMTTPAASEQIERLVEHALPASLPTGHLGLWEADEQIAKLIAEFGERFGAAISRGGAGARRGERTTKA